MVEEIRQDGKVILSSEDVFSVPMIFNNLCGKNFIGKEYKDYIRHIAFEEMGLKPGIWKIQCKMPPKTKRFYPLVPK